MGLPTRSCNNRAFAEMLLCDYNCLHHEINNCEMCRVIPQRVTFNKISLLFEKNRICIRSKRTKFAWNKDEFSENFMKKMV